MEKTFSTNSDSKDEQYHRYVIAKIKRGIERAKSEGVISHEDAKKRLRKWIEI